MNSDGEVTQPRHRIFPPQRMHTRSRSNTNADTASPASPVTIQSKKSEGNDGRNKEPTKERKPAGKKFAGGTCGEAYTTRTGLQGHDRIHVKDDTVHRFVKCQDTSVSKAEFEQHAQTHTEDEGRSENTSSHPVCNSVENSVQISSVQDHSTASVSTSVDAETRPQAVDTSSPDGQTTQRENGVDQVSIEKSCTNTDDQFKIKSADVPTCVQQVQIHVGENVTQNIPEEEIMQIDKVIDLGCLNGVNDRISNVIDSNSEVLTGTDLGVSVIAGQVKKSKCDKGANFNFMSSDQELVKLPAKGKETSDSGILETRNQDVVRHPVILIRTNSNDGRNVAEQGEVTLGAFPHKRLRHYMEDSEKLAQLSDTHVCVKSHFSKEDIENEVKDDPILGLVSGLVKFCPDLSDMDYTEVAKVTGVTVIMLDKQKIVIHGSWKALNRAYSMIESLHIEAEKKNEAVRLAQCVKLEDTMVQLSTSDEDTMMAEDTTPEVVISNSSADDMDSISNPVQDTFMCDHCSTPFWSRCSLQEHVAAKHSDHKCKICDKVFQERRYLQTHLKRHAKIRNYACPICGWKFLERYKMKLHMESHKELRDRVLPYKCTICGNQFYNKASWSDHLNTHSGNKPFTCGICSSSFAHRIGLKRHLLVHSKEKPYKCTHAQCDKTFSFSSKLEQHRTMHTGLSKHQCNNCQRIFTVRASLKRHKQQCVGKPNNLPANRKNVDPTQPAVHQTEASEVDTPYIYMCGICGTTFDTLAKAEIHTAEHDQDAATTVVDETKEVVYTDKMGVDVIGIVVDSSESRFKP